MLVLARKKGQRIILHTLDGPIELEVVESRGAQVRLGITAPDSVGIYREEVWLERQAQRKEEREKNGEQRSSAE